MVVDGVVDGVWRNWLGVFFIPWMDDMYPTVCM